MKRFSGGFSVFYLYDNALMTPLAFDDGILDEFALQ
jgi:hypothetical protein